MINGILVVNKPKNYTSRDVVNKVSKIFKTKKIGHTGTLDPIASGVLVLTIGKATKLSEVITSEEKTYIATAILGLQTETLDTEGEIIKEADVTLSKDEVKNALLSFKKTYNQEVPIYSAVKVNGRKLYEYARNNEEVSLPSREVTIKDIELLDINYENNKTVVKFMCTVSKGTYIRSLINDIALSLNTFGIMSDLVRIKQGEFDIRNSYTLEQIENNEYEIINLEDVLKDYFTVAMDEELEFKVKNGVVLNNIYNQEYVLFKSKDVLALYKYENGKLKPFKMFI